MQLHAWITKCYVQLDRLPGEVNMRYVIFALLIIICILMLVAYSLLVKAHDADERAERMYIKWKEEKDERISDKEEN